MSVVTQNKVENVRYLFGSPSTVKSRYNQIKRTFPEGKEYLIFSEPVFVENTNSIIWSTEHKGTIINYGKLSQTDQTIAQKLLTKSIQIILSAAKQFETSELTDFIYNCIEIPSMDSVFLVRNQNQDNVVITQWGFVSDAAGMEKGLLAKIINITRADMNFNVIYQDKEEPAPNEKFFFEYEGQTQTHISDDKGNITLKDVRIDEEVKTYQKEGENQQNQQSFVCYEAGKYTLKAIRKVDMNFTVLDPEDKTVSGQTFIFEHAGQQIKLTSNEQGKIQLPNVEINTEVIAYQQKEKEKENEHKFICEKDKDYILRLKPTEEEPEPIHNMKFKIIDHKGNPVENAKVKIKYNNKTVEKITDAQGYTILEDMTPQTEVKVVAVGKIKKSDKK